MYNTADVEALDSDELAAALEEANLETLLMVHTHLIHDEAFLEAFAPYIKPLYGPEPSSVPDALAAELRERLHKLLSQGGCIEVPPLPRDLIGAREVPGSGHAHGTLG